MAENALLLSAALLVNVHSCEKVVAAFQCLEDACLIVVR